MNRRLNIVNFVGVLALATLCVFQWQLNRRLNLETANLLQARAEQAAKLEEQNKSLNGLGADLDGFREQLARAVTAKSRAELKRAEGEREVRQLTNERDQLKTSVTNWAAAVAERDARLKTTGEQLKALAQDRNGTIEKYNELGRKYETVVNEMNQRTRQYRELLTNYNRVVGELNGLRSATPNTEAANSGR